MRVTPSQSAESQRPLSGGSFRVISPSDPSVHTSAKLREVSEVNEALPFHDFSMRRTGTQSWQRVAFEFSMAIGQVGKVNHLRANTVAACELRAVYTDPETGQQWTMTELLALPGEGEEEETPERRQLREDAKAVKRVQDAFTAPVGGRRELLRKASLNLSIAGEAFLLGSPTVEQLGAVQKEDSPELVWEFLSPQEIDEERFGAIVRRRQGYLGGVTERVNEGDYIARIWQSDPEFSELPDSGMKRALVDCKQYIKLRDVIDASADSRLPAGIVKVPEGLDGVGMPQDSDDPNEEGARPFTEALVSHIAATFENPQSGTRVMPVFAIGDPDLLSGLDYLDLGDEQNASWASALRQEVLGSISEQLDSPPEMVTGKGNANHWCYPASTKLYTRRGWASIHEVVIGDEFLTMDHTTGVAEWRPSVDLYQAPVENQEMIRLKARVKAQIVHDSLTTPNHRWPILRDGLRLMVEASDVVPGDHIVLSAPSTGLPTEAKFSDAFVQLVAWYSADGTAIGNLPQVRIGKSHKVNPDKVAILQKIFMEMFGPEFEGPIPPRLRGDGVARWTKSVQDRGMTMFCPNKPATEALLAVVPTKEKIIPSWFVDQLTESQLHLFIEAWLDSDGDENSRTISGGGAVFQKVPQRLDALERAALLLGRGVRRWTKISGGFGKFELHCLSIRTTSTAKVVEVSSESYTGEVWCPTVPPHHTVCALEGEASFFSGQSGYSVDAEYNSKWVIPQGEFIAEFTTISYLQAMLEKFEQWDDDKSKNWRHVFDASNITARADKGVTAVRLADRGWISEESVVLSNGFTLADMPSLEERRIKILKDLITANAALAPQLLPLIPGFEEVVLVDNASPGGIPPAPPGADETPGISGGDPESGGREPLPPTQQIPGGPPADARLVERIVAASDAAIDRALERAGSRAVSRINLSKIDSSKIAAADRLRVDKSRALASLGPADFIALEVTPESLLDGAWDDLSLKVRGWVQPWVVERCGFNGAASLDVARSITEELCSRLQTLTLADRGTRSYDDGFKLPVTVVVGALETAAIVRW